MVRRRALVVEDVDAMRLYLRLILENQGFTVDEAGDCREALSYLRAGNRPTSILLDLELPNGHGLDIVRVVPPDVPIIALSADESKETELQCRYAGCSAVLSKSGHLGNLGQLMADMEDRAKNSSAAPAPESELAQKYNAYLAEAKLQLQRAQASSDIESIRRIAHRLKGTAVHFGYSSISAIARLILDVPAAGEDRRIHSALDELLERLADATTYYRMY
jgi:CheY-like chemotaxis protein